MSLSHSGWKGRRKRLRRRLAHDLRTALPLLGLVFCLAGSAAAIVGVERAPVASLPVVSSGPPPSDACGTPIVREMRPAAPAEPAREQTAAR